MWLHSEVGQAGGVGFILIQINGLVFFTQGQVIGRSRHAGELLFFLLHKAGWTGDGRRPERVGIGHSRPGRLCPQLTGRVVSRAREGMQQPLVYRGPLCDKCSMKCQAGGGGEFLG